MSAGTAAALTPERRRTLEAVVERILPGIEGPGAVGTGVAVAFEDAIAHPHLRGVRPGIERMLDHLQAQAEQVHGREFFACAPGQRDELLRAIERDANPGMQFLFRAFVTLSLEGLLGDPVHGGNRDCRGWESIGLQAPDVRSGLCCRGREC